MSNRGFERSMNGINDIEVNEVQFPDGSTISSASNLVQLDTNNNFIAFNTFDVNLPTSTKTPDSANQFTTKTYVDNLPDANDYPTAFERDGTTGIVKLSVNDTGTPLSGDTTYTSITDAQISQIATNTSDIANNTSDIATNTTDIANNTSDIATNTTAISGLTTATNECFDDVVISGNDLIFSRVDDANPKTIAIPTTDTADFVNRTTDQTIDGLKTFDTLPQSSLMPTNSYDLTRKGYIDTNFLQKTGGTLTGKLYLDAGCEVESIEARDSGGISLKSSSDTGTGTGITIFNNGDFGYGFTSQGSYPAKFEVRGANQTRAFNLQASSNFDPMVYNYNGQLYLRADNYNTAMVIGYGGHHLDVYNVSSTTYSGVSGKRLWINYFSNQQVWAKSITSSDDRLKEEETPIQNATETILKLKPTNYIIYAPKQNTGKIEPNYDISGYYESGLIAQEVYKIPELRHIVDYDADVCEDANLNIDENPDFIGVNLGINYTCLIPFLIKSNQELHERIKALEQLLKKV